MFNKKATKRALLTSIVSLFLCFAMLLGTTFAWFTDSVSNTGNRIIAGTLKIDLLMHKKVAETYQYTSIAGGSGDLFREATRAQNDPASLWEPGKTQIVFLAVQNKGSLALKYNIILDISDISGYPSMVHGEPADADYYTALEFALLDGAKAISETQFTYGGNTYTLSTLNWTTVQAATAQKDDVELGRVVAAENGVMDELPNVAPNYETQYFALAVHMKEDAGNEFQGAGINIDVNVVATQYNSEDDIFDNPNYDKDTVLPAVALLINGYSAKTYEPDAVVDTVIEDVAAVSTIPAGTAVTVEGGTTYDTLDSDTTGQLNRIISSTATEESVTYDISYTFTTTTTVGTETTVKTEDVESFSTRVVNELEIGKDLKIVKVTHSHGGSTVEMSQLSSKEEDANGYWYDHVSGVLTIKSDKYSEFAVQFDSKIAVESLSVDPDTVTLDVGQSTNIIGLVLPDTATYRTITWTSSDPASVAVNSNGQVTAIKPGVITVTATADGVSATCKVTSVAEAILNNDKYYASLNGALAVAGNNDTVTVLRNSTDQVTVNGVENLTIDLGGFELTPSASSYAICVYDCDGVTIRNGTVNGQIRIGEHKWTIVRWILENDKVTLRALNGYHPLAPARNVLFDNVNMTAVGAKSIFYFTNIEDDLTRGDAYNAADRDLYGHYIYKEGYKKISDSESNWPNGKNTDGEVFTFLDATDTVTVRGGTFTSSNAMTGNMCDINGRRYSEVLKIEAGSFTNDSLGRFVAEGKYLVGSAPDSFMVTDSLPADYTAKIDHIVYIYAGGANDAIKRADIGDTVCIKENADAQKTMGLDDVFTVISEADGVSWTGAVAASGYEIVATPDTEHPENVVYTTAVYCVATLYKTDDSRYPSNCASAEYKMYGTLAEAFADAARGNIIKLEKDIELAQEGTYNSTGYAIFYNTGCGFDLNGHTLVYTGNGAAILSSCKSGSSGAETVLMDSSSGKTGKIIATKGYCFGKKNTGSEVVSIRGGSYISQQSYAIWIDNCNNLTIYDGYFEGPTNWLSKKTIGTLDIKGGTFSPSQDAQFTDSTCFASGTLITLADGTQKAIELLDGSEKILVWNFFTGEYDQQDLSILVNHGEADYLVSTLEFSNGSTIRLIGDHGLFDYDLNRFVYVTAENLDSYVGHRFVVAGEGGTYEFATLVGMTEAVERTVAYSISSVSTFNAFADGFLTVAPPEDFYNWIAMGDPMRYDAEQFAADLATYGTYEYDIFADYVTYEQYEAFNGAYLKIAVEKGYFTFDYIVELIDTYLSFMR